ncbi:MAG: hypothetical protein ABIP95_16760 [Pelobium sp.]
MNNEQLFYELFKCHNEKDLAELLKQHNIFNDENWRIIHLNLSDNGFLLEDKLKPLMPLAKYLHECLTYPKATSSKSNDLQILADGDLNTPSISIYCAWINEPFEKIHSVTNDFLKNYISPIIHSGGLGYLLVAQKEKNIVKFFLFKRGKEKNTLSIWCPNTQMPFFKSDKSLNLNLFNTAFATGSISKFYSYKLPSSSRSVISRDLKRSLEELYFKPKSPYLIVDRESRFPKDIHLEREVFGLNSILNKPDNRYVHQKFEETHFSPIIGELSFSIYLLKYSVDNTNYNRSLSIIKREIFKHKMKVIVTVDGVMEYYFKNDLLEALGYSEIKNHILINVNLEKRGQDPFNEKILGLDKVLIELKEILRCSLRNKSLEIDNFKEELSKFILTDS